MLQTPPAAKKWRLTLPITTVLGLLLAWPSFAAPPDCEARAVRAQEAIPAERMASWEPLGDRALLVWTADDPRAHLVRLDRPVPGLLGAPTVFLVTRSHDRNVCACGHDAIMVPGGGTARIVSIRYLSRKRTAQLDPGRPVSSQARVTFT